MAPPGLIRSRTRPGTGYHPADLLVLVYLVIVSALLIFSPRNVPDRGLLTAVHLGLLLAVAALRFVPREGSGVGRVLRHMYPLALLPLAYRDVAVLNRLLTERYFDAPVSGWDRVLFGFDLSQVLHQWVPLGAVSEYVHLSYLVYAALIPLVCLPLYLSHRRGEFRLFTTAVIATFTACYLTFIVFPVQGPFHYFGPIDPAAKRSFFAVLADRMLHRASATGTAFPSSHVAVAVVVWAMCRRMLPRLSPFVLVITVGIFLGTVYGGFHYGVDALAGVIVGLLFAHLGPRIHLTLLRWLGREGEIELLPAALRGSTARHDRPRMAPVSPLAPAHRGADRPAAQADVGEAARAPQGAGAER